MPYTEQGLPFSGRAPISRHAGQKAAESLAPTRGEKTRRMLAFFRKVHAATDHQLSDELRLPLQSICSLRNGLVDRGLVEAFSTCRGRYGKNVTIWRLRQQETR
jgi:hypothetical protein